MTNAEQVDAVISAELPPDPETLSEEAREQARRLEEYVLKNMIHGPCGQYFPNCPCMDQGKCSKSFPKSFCRDTIVDPERCHPVYHRRSPADGGRVIKVKKGNQEVTIDNQWVVPYSPYLGLRYNCHINIELAVSPTAAKYLYGYICKGSDRAMMRTEVDNFEERNEVDDYKDLRSIGSSEAVWRLRAFPISKMFPAVYALRIHLQDEQQVYFDEGAELVGMENARNTELTAFFEFNLANPTGVDGELYRYVDFPKKCTYNARKKEWTFRKREFSTIGRVHSVNPIAGDVFYLRMLLHHDHCKGKTSHRDMMTMPGNNDPEESYKEVCRKLGLLQDDNEWDEALTEAESTKMSPALRELYVTILLFCEPSNPYLLFENHWGEFGDDFARNPELTATQIKTLVTLDIQRRLEAREKCLADYGLVAPTDEEIINVSMQTRSIYPMVIMEELEFDWADMKDMAAEQRELYTTDQVKVYQRVMECVHSHQPLFLFIYARGGCGKTFLINGLLAEIRSSEPSPGAVALAMATTGIAGDLMLQGRTFHSRMKVSCLTPSEDMMFAISGQSALAQLIRMAKVLIIDGKFSCKISLINKYKFFRVYYDASLPC